MHTSGQAFIWLAGCHLPVNRDEGHCGGAYRRREECEEPDDLAPKLPKLPTGAVLIQVDKWVVDVRGRLATPEEKTGGDHEGKDERAIEEGRQVQA